MTGVQTCALPISQHIGPVAQDFHAAFSLGSDDKSITTVDAEGVALTAIQGLNAKMEEAESDIRRLLKLQQKQIDALKAEIATLMAGRRP